jgi:calcium/calmodulin-dependent protein kinase I
MAEKLTTGVWELSSTFCKTNFVVATSYRLCGFPPFYEENNQKLFDMIKSCTFEFPSPYWDDISEPAKDLIKSLLVADPKARFDCDQILACPWVMGETTPRLLLPSVPTKMKEYNAKRRFKKAGYLIIAAHRFKNILKIK